MIPAATTRVPTRPAVPATAVESVIRSSDASLVCTSTTAPEGTVSTGGIAALQ